jgi:ribosomal protein S18 acetylase RimI-like enzyme
MPTSVDPRDAADLFQNHRDELGFVNRAQCREGDLVTESRDGRVVGALLGNHCVRKPQSTVYELAVAPEYRHEGIGRSLVRQFANQSPHDKLVAKCPATLPATDFYEATGWERIDTEDGKNRALAVFEKSLDDTPTLITTGRRDLTEIAGEYGFLRGARLDHLGHYEANDTPVDFIDLHWEDPDVEGLMEAAERHQPRYIIAGDYDGDNIAEINERGEYLRDYAENVIIVPHEPGEVERVPEWAVVGYSTPTKYAGTDAPIWEYTGRDVHILGGKIEQICEIYAHLAESVVSIDSNSWHRGATSFAKWWGKSSPSWNKLATATAQPENANRAYENSMLNITYSLRENGVISR